MVLKSSSPGNSPKDQTVFKMNYREPNIVPKVWYRIIIWLRTFMTLKISLNHFWRFNKELFLSSWKGSKNWRTKNVFFLIKRGSESYIWNYFGSVFYFQNFLVLREPLMVFLRRELLNLMKFFHFLALECIIATDIEEGDISVIIAQN